MPINFAICPDGPKFESAIMLSLTRSKLTVASNLSKWYLSYSLIHLLNPGNWKYHGMNIKQTTLYTHRCVKFCRIHRNTNTMNFMELWLTEENVHTLSAHRRPIEGLWVHLDSLFTLTLMPMYSGQKMPSLPVTGILYFYIKQKKNFHYLSTSSPLAHRL